MKPHLPRLALTPGEPAGIGPDLVLLLAAQSIPARLLVMADPDLLAARAQALGRRVTLVACDDLSGEIPVHRPGQLAVYPVGMTGSATPGQLDRSHARYVLRTLERACDTCLTGQLDALVTGPVHKGIINEAGIPFSGHTEFLAARTGGHPVMLLVANTLRVALATTHLPLKNVAAAITPQRLSTVITTLAKDLRQRFGLPQPRITVCGLNPHAGEGGHLGDEEQNVIIPTLATLRERGVQLSGPVPADTAFTPQNLASTDVVLAMYHDQGLPVLKHVGFGHAVNVTLGLPIIRTSVDHGTAVHLAGTGQVDCGSLRAAIALACQQVTEINDAG